MKRLLSWIGRARWRRIPFRHLALLVVLGLLSGLGFRHAHAPAPATAKDAAQKRTPLPRFTLAAFSKLRPRTGDQMVLPRLGFRWSFSMDGDTEKATQASMMPNLIQGAGSIRSVGTHAIRFLLHLVGPGGKPEIVRETTASEIRLDLKGRMPSGECEWWVEALLPGQPPVRSDKERFVLQP